MCGNTYSDTAGTTVLKNWYQEGRWRFVFVEEPVGNIVSALLAKPVETERWGRVCDVKMLLAKPSLSDANKLRALDVLILWMCNRLQSEGVQVAFGRQPRSFSTYVEQGLGATIDEDHSDAQSVLLWGRTNEIAARILARHPAWLM